MKNTSSDSSQLRVLLSALLPREGRYCGVFIGPKKQVQQAWFSSVEEFETSAASADASGWDAYFGCASYRRDSRLQLDVLAVRSLWLDVDCGADKPYATVADAAVALARFCQAAVLPVPAVVSSGYGLHIYWPLADDVAPDEWKRYAEGLKALCRTHGFGAGPERTADSASILRLPGTHNYKRGGKVPVSLVQMKGPYELSAFVSLLSAGAGDPGVPVPARARAPRAQLGRLGPVAAGMANIYASDFADAQAVADRCAQVGRMRETQGLVTEPVWKGVMGVLAHCKDGEELAHEWSEGDPRYDSAETQGKFDRSLAFGPTTCAHFRDINAAGCSGCVFAGRVTSPVQLGRQQVQNSVASTAAGSPVAIRSDAQPAAPVGQQMPLLPPDFTFGSDGKLRLSRSGPTGDEPIIVAHNPVHLLGASRGEIRKDVVTLVLRHFLPSEGWNDVEVPASTLFGAMGNAAIAGKGILVENADAFKKFVRDSFNLHVSAKKLGKMYEQCGWKDDDTAFLAGNKLYRATGIEEITGSAEIAFRSQLIGPRPGGSLEGWKQRVDALFGVGREASTFAMLSGFAAPLIRFLSSTEGGAVVSVVSRESGQGKSVGIDGATSIWGNGEALRLINFDTQVARAITWGVLGNLPCVLDDIAHKDAEQARDFIQRFTDGRDKMRGTREGEIRHLLANWQTILITSSNHSLVDMITSIGGTSAMAYRILHFEASLPEGVDKKRGEQARREMLQNWGYAGDAYLRYLLRPDVLPVVKGMVGAVQQDLIERHGYSTEHRFWTRTLACVFVAHSIVHKMGFVNFPPNVISDWAVDQTKAMGGVGKEKHHGHGNLFESDSAAEVLATFISDNIDHMLILSERPREGAYAVPLQPLPRGSVKIRLEQKQDRMYISEETLRRYLVKRQVSFSHFQKQMRERGCLVDLPEKRSLTHGTHIKSGATRLLCFNTAHPDISGNPQIALVAESLPQQGTQAR